MEIELERREGRKGGNGKENERGRSVVREEPQKTTGKKPRQDFANKPRKLWLGTPPQTHMNGPPLCTAGLEMAGPGSLPPASSPGWGRTQWTPFGPICEKKHKHQTFRLRGSSPWLNLDKAFARRAWALGRDEETAGLCAPHLLWGEEALAWFRAI